MLNTPTKALIRDGFRCMLSGEIEVNVWKVNPSAFPPVDIVSAGPTQCCHIMPKLTNDFSSVNDEDDTVRSTVSRVILMHRADCRLYSVVGQVEYGRF